METFQRMNALDADALRRIYRKFQEVDRVRRACRTLDAARRCPPASC
jgi:hypothetical protein